MSDILLKCRKCRYILLTHPQTTLLNAHGEVLTSKDDGVVSSPALESRQLCEDSVWYLKEDNIPPWIQEKVNEAGWLKDKLHCPQCRVRIGGLDFVSGSKCSCGGYALPPVQLVKSKLDFSKPLAATRT